MSREYRIVNAHGEMWANGSWTIWTCFAEKYGYDEGLAVIDKRFSNGVRRPRATAPSKFILLPKPELKPVKLMGRPVSLQESRE